jgi:hypothetical protein
LGSVVLYRAIRRRYNSLMPALSRAVAAVLLLACLPATTVRAADAPAGIEAVRDLAQGGAVQLALRRIDALQPPDTAAPSPKGTSSGAHWVEWERLRLQLLARLGRNNEVLQRAGLLPHTASGAHAGLHAIAARAGLVLGQAAVAREHAGRALWSAGLDAGSLRELRLLVIRSYARESRADDAWRSMLRHEQDYRPLDAATATVFVDALLDLGMAREAVTWLGLLEEHGAAKLRLRLHAGVVAPQDAVAQARAALARGEDPAWWRILLEAAERQKNAALRIAALEQLLESKRDLDTPATAADANGLWAAYAGYARDAANAHHLLVGDDESWLEFAVRSRGTAPVAARAYLAYLARHARAPAMQQEAQARLAADYAGAKLPRVALRLFAAWPGEAAALAAPARHTLGMLAESSGDHLRAFGYWQGLPAPEHTATAVWWLRLAAVALRAGRAHVAADIARQLAAEPFPIPAGQLPEWTVLAQQLADHGLLEAAQALFERMLPHADAVQTRGVLSGIARIHASRNQPLLAADFYLRSALRAPKEVPLGGAPKEVPLGDAPAADTAAAKARLLAGLSLARAGLREDARAQFEWVLQNARDPEQIAVARRELGF